MKHLYIMPGRGGWWFAYSSKWSWFFGREPVLRAKTWTAMSQAVEELKASEGKRLLPVRAESGR